MAKLLYIESSPRKARSKSIGVAKAFIDAYKAANPGDEVVTKPQRNCRPILAIVALSIAPGDGSDKLGHLAAGYISSNL